MAEMNQGQTDTLINSQSVGFNLETAKYWVDWESRRQAPGLIDDSTGGRS